MKYGLNSAAMMQALHLYLGGVKEVAIIGHRKDPETEEMRKLARTGFFPNAVFAFAYEDDPNKNKIPLLADKKTTNGKTTAYVCNRGTCLPPVNTPQDLAKLLLG